MQKPVYQQLIEDLKEEVSTKSPNEPILSERELAIKYNVSRMTVRKAIESLVDDGYLYRIKNKGTFIADEKLRKTSVHTAIQVETGADDDYHIIYFNVKPMEKDIAEKLSISFDEMVLKVVRTHIKNKKPQCVDEIHFIKKYLTNKEINEMNKLLNVNLFSEEKPLSQTFYPIIVPMKFAKILELKQGTPIIMVENIVRNQAGVATLFFRTYLNPNEKTIQINS